MYFISSQGRSGTLKSYFSKIILTIYNSVQEHIKNVPFPRFAHALHHKILYNMGNHVFYTNKNVDNSTLITTPLVRCRTYEWLTYIITDGLQKFVGSVSP